MSNYLADLIAIEADLQKNFRPARTHALYVPTPAPLLDERWDDDDEPQLRESEKLVEIWM